MKKRLTIITITKDDYEGVCSTIASTEQLREHIGVIQIIVDSSEHATAEKLKSYSVDQDNLEYTWIPPTGIAPAFNHGLSMVKSGWVWFLNGRDELHPDLNITTFMDVVCSCRAEALIFELEFMQSHERYKHPYLWALWPPVQFWIPHPSTLVRAELFEKFGYFKDDFKVAMDGELWFRLFSKNVIVDMLSIPITLYDESGLSRTLTCLTAAESKKIIVGNLPMLLRKWFESGVLIFKSWRDFQKRSRP